MILLAIIAIALGAIFGTGLALGNMIAIGSGTHPKAPQPVRYPFYRPVDLKV